MRGSPITSALLAQPLDLTAVIIAFNEKLHIARCIERLRGLAARVVVIDSYSTDGTVDIARALGATVIQHPFVNHAAQFNWGVEAADVRTGWVLRIDADEYLDDKCIAGLRTAIRHASPNSSAFAMRRGVVFQEKRIRFGGISQVFLTRVWRTGCAKVEARWMDEQVLVSLGETQRITDGAIIDENLNDIGWWTSKHNGYTTRQMIQSMLGELQRADAIDINQLNRHVRRKRILRERIYGPAPLFSRAIGYFLYRYFIGSWISRRTGRLSVPFLPGIVELLPRRRENLRGAQGGRAWRRNCVQGVGQPGLRHRAYGILTVAGQPKVAVLIGAAWPDNDASGPVQSVRQIVARFASEARFELFARSGAPGEPPKVAHRTRVAHPWGGITYLDVDRLGARDLRAVLVASRCDRIWLNSVWDREFTLPTLAWRRFGSALPAAALLSTRGEFSVGALKLHARRKAAMRTFLKASGMLSGIRFHATTADELRDVARSFPDHSILVAGNLRGMPPQEPHVPAQDGCLRLLYLGRISPVKGLHNALAALSRVTVPTRFTVCGPVHDASYFKKCLELLGALPKSIEVKFPGPVANAEATAQYAAADLFLNPSASENFGHTIFELLEPAPRCSPESPRRGAGSRAIVQDLTFQARTTRPSRP